jgi:hypothetical protein
MGHSFYKVAIKSLIYCFSDIIKKKKYCPNSFHSQTMDTKIELMRGIYNRADAW